MGIGEYESCTRRKMKYWEQKILQFIDMQDISNDDDLIIYILL